MNLWKKKYFQYFIINKLYIYFIRFSYSGTGPILKEKNIVDGEKYVFHNK